MTIENFKTSLPVPQLIFNLWLATLIIMAGFVMPDIHQMLHDMQVLPMLGMIVLITAAYLYCIQPETQPFVEIQEEIMPTPAATPPALTLADHQFIMGQLAHYVIQSRTSANDDPALKIMQQLSPPQLAVLELPLSETVKRALESIRPMLPTGLVLQFGDLSRIKSQVLINENQMAQLIALLMLNAGHTTNYNGMVAVHLRRPADIDVVRARHGLGAQEFAELVIADNRNQPPHENELLGAIQIAKSWGGAIEMEYQPGKGAVAHVYIPEINA